MSQVSPEKVTVLSNGDRKMGQDLSERVRVLSKAYLIMYNSVLAVAWSLVLLKTSIYISEKKSHEGLYDEIDFWLKVAQTSAVLEIAHSLLGIVKTPVGTLFFQLLSRVCVLWIVIDGALMKHEDTKYFFGFPMILFAWTITEIVRYSYYTNLLLDCVAYSLIWCRYSFFIVLYPLGVTGEILCIIKALPYLDNVKNFTWKLPNKLNFSLNLIYCAYISLLVYLPVLYILYSYMLRQRKKVLGKYQQKED